MSDPRHPYFPPEKPQAGLAATQDEQLLKQAYQYHSYSGTDMLCLMHMPQTPPGHYTKMGYTATDAREIPQTAIKAFAELQTLTVSSARNVSPVRRLGESHVHKYTRGARTIAGTLVFALLDRDVFGEFYRQSPAEIDSGAPFFVDQIPEFHIFVSGENEYGGRVSAGLLNITLTNFGQTVSVDDIYTEVTYTYVAQFFLPFVEDTNVFLNKVQKVTEYSRVALSTKGFDPNLETSIANRAGMSQDTLDEMLLDNWWWLQGNNPGF
jgi:hypothetical protein